MGEHPTRKMRISVLAGLCCLASAIYTDDHWTRATKLTVANFDETVKREVDAGKTFFVRWIASAG